MQCKQESQVVGQFAGAKMYHYRKSSNRQERMAAKAVTHRAGPSRAMARWKPVDPKPSKAFAALEKPGTIPVWTPIAGPDPRTCLIRLKIGNARCIWIKVSLLLNKSRGATLSPNAVHLVPPFAITVTYSCNALQQPLTPSPSPRKRGEGGTQCRVRGCENT